jgi:hypothetical protein
MKRKLSRRTRRRNLYRTLYPETVPYRLGPHVTGELVALILFGQLTKKGITEDRKEYYRISFDDYFSYPIEVQFPTEEVSLVVDFFSNLQHVTGDARKGRQYFLPGSIGQIYMWDSTILFNHSSRISVE